MEGVPRQKVIPGTTFTVDCFQTKWVVPATTAHFLSHAHADHYQGITERWKAGPIYCSEITGALVAHILGVDPQYIHTLPLNEPVTVLGVEVTLVDANHCPGAVQLCFELPGGLKYLHCGDARYCASMQQDPTLQRFVGARAVFLDTTYCSPKYTFPLQEVAVDYIASTIERLMKDGSGRKRAYVISTYVIGKERILLQVRKRCGVRLHVSERKLGIIRCLNLPGVDVDEVFTLDPAATPVSVASWGFLGDTWPYFRPNFKNCEQHRTQHNADEVVAFVPTGWMYEFKKDRSAFPIRKKGDCQIHLVPYSEHSSYLELREYVKFLKPQELVPTVGCSGGEKAIGDMLKHFRGLVNETAAKSHFLRSFSSRTDKEDVIKAEVSDSLAGQLQQLDPPEGLVSVASDCSDKSTLGLDKSTTAPPQPGITPPGLEPSPLLLSKMEEVQQPQQQQQRRKGSSSAASMGASGIKREPVWAQDHLSPQQDRKRVASPSASPLGASRVKLEPVPVQELPPPLQPGLGSPALSAKMLNAAERQAVAAKARAAAQAAAKAHQGGRGYATRRRPGADSPAQGASSLAAQINARSAAALPAAQPTAPCVAPPDSSPANPPANPSDPADSGPGPSDSSDRSAGVGMDTASDTDMAPASQSDGTKTEDCGPSAGSGGALAGDTATGRAGAVSPVEEPEEPSPGAAEQHMAAALEGSPAAGASSPAAVFSAVAAAAKNDDDDDDDDDDAHGGDLDVRECDASGSGSGREGDAGAGPSNQRLNELLAVLGSTVASWKAEELLEQAGGDVAAALNLHFSTDAYTPEDPDAVSSGSKRTASIALPSTPKAGNKKRKASGTGKGPAKPTPAKKGNVMRASKAPDRNQQAITSFFVASPPASPAPKTAAPAAGLSHRRAGAQQQASSPAGKQKLRLPSLTQHPSEAHMPPQAPGEQNTVDAVDAGNAANDSHNPSVSLHPASLQDLPAPERRLSIAHDSIKTGMPSDTEPGGMTDPPDGAAQQTIPSALDAHAHAGAKLLAPSAADCSAVNPAPPAATDQSGADAPALPKPFMTPAETTTPHGSPAPSPALSRGPSPAPSFAPSPVAASPASPALKSHKLPGTEPDVPADIVAVVPAAEVPVTEPNVEALASASTAAEPAAAALPPPLAGATTKSIRDYRPLEDACWAQGQPTPYLHLAQALAAMDNTTKRLKISDVVCNMFRSVLALSPDDVLAACYLALGKLAPDFEQIELRVGGSTIATAISEATGVTRAQLGRMHNVMGDMGDVAEKCRVKQSMLVKPAVLTVAGVYKALRTIALTKGQGSAQKKQALMKQLISRCRGVETKYLVRMLAQNLRVGANWRSIVSALARAVLLHREGSAQGKAAQDAAAKAALDAFHLCPSLNVLVPALVEGGPGDLQRRCRLTPGVPLKPMLAKICEGIPDAISQLRAGGGRFLAEFKYDGVRAQIHLLPDGTVKVFSRNCEDRSGSFPDIGDALRAAAAGGASSMVLDAEVVAVDRSAPPGADGGTVLKAFQELSTRARSDITAAQVTVPVCIFAFDALFADGEALTGLSLRERRLRLAQMLPNLRPGYVELARSVEISSVADASTPPASPAPPTTATTDISIAAADLSAAATAAVSVAAENISSAAVSEEAANGFGPAAPIEALQQPSIAEVASPAHSSDSQHPPQASAQPTEGALAAAGEPLHIVAGIHEGWPSGVDREGAGVEGDGEGVDGDEVGVDGAEESLVMASQPAAEAAAEADEVAQDAAAQVQDFLLQSFAAGTEGLMLKRLDEGATYQPSKRSESWIKIKRDYCEGLRDSLDLVPIGGWHGNGRKAGWISPFLLASWDPETETFATVCRCMSGFSDVFYKEATERLMATRLPGPKPYYVTGESPQVWFEPREVWEIRGADLTLSPVHKAAAGRMHADRGVSLRFPRYIRSRPDKGVEDSTGPEVLEDLYNRQTRRMQTAQEKLGRA